ncbi:amino acid ABC transporter substrate-binding protein [Acidovorax sp. A1169]|uniref:amino acid ABC transporter substrate-binding protein n=1 Tax=Acidovorax sp. A1169 TaxID=3059524 RepID=UPI002737C3DA|nr:amino acid ABC transporter substrate-binding protein [Acidovorax sp. A1169]MDP4077012.1 amino acid ABC transporter substrate-binding protein [Acidovorax sp. A1169]
MKNQLLLPIATATALLCFLGNAVAQTDTLKKIKDSGVITMGVRDGSGAMSYTLGPGVYTGFHVEVCERVIADVKKALGVQKLDVKYLLVTPQNRIPLVQNGTVDIECGTTTNNTARQKDVAFAPTLYVEGVRVAVKKASGITSTSQLIGKTVGATSGSTAVQQLRKLKRDGGGGEVGELFAKDNSEGFLLLESDRVQGFIADGQILATLISKSKDPSQYELLDQVLSVEPIAIMLPKGDPGFKKLVDQSVLAIAQSGEAARLYDKWFMKPIPPSSLKVGLPPNALTQAAWKGPSDKPMEAYEVK